jgi:hypothetical protein
LDLHQIVCDSPYLYFPPKIMTSQWKKYPTAWRKKTTTKNTEKDITKTVDKRRDRYENTRLLSIFTDGLVVLNASQFDY